MAVSRRRCVACKEYRLVGDLLRTRPVLCSSECAEVYKADQRQKQAKKKAEQKQPSKKWKGLPAKKRQRLIDRDGGRCRRCDGSEYLHIHHVRFRSEGGPDNSKNLLSLCQRCHDIVHRNKKHYQPLLLLMLWIQYEQQQTCTLKEVKAKATPELLDQARQYSDALMARRE